MAIYRNVSMNFWTDSKVVDDFTPEDRYFYLYLVTNPHTTLSGCYEISARQMSNEIGYTREAVENLIKRFQTVHKVIYYSVDTKEILLLNWHKYNWSKSDKFIKAVVAEMERIKEPAFKQYLMDVIENGDSEIRYPIDTVSTENFNDGYGMDTTVTVTVSDTVSDTVPDTVSDTVPEAIPDTGKKDKAGKVVKPKEPKETYGEYRNVKLTQKEKEKLDQEFGHQKTDAAIDYLDAYIEEKHYKSASHYLAMRRWVFNAIDERDSRWRNRASPGQPQEPRGADAYFAMAQEAEQ